MYSPTSPYNDLPTLPPAGFSESPQVLKAVISASRALALVTGLGKSIPNQTILINSVVLQEAKYSSEIENIVTTNDELYQALSTDDLNLNPAAKEVIGYREALWTGYLQLADRPFLDTNLFIKLVGIVNGHSAGVRTNPGTNIKNQQSGEVVYTPPVGEEIIRKQLKELGEFYSRTDTSLDPLVKLALGHYQFEAVHPFADGNGRTGRIINILYLVQQGLLDIPILYLSRYIIQNKGDYYRRLRAVTERSEWEAWVLFVLNAIEETAIYTAEKLKQIKESMDATADLIRTKEPRMYTKDLVELLYEQPYARISSLVDKKIAARRTSSEYLHKLVNIGVLQIVAVGRDKLFLNTRLYEILRGIESSSPKGTQPTLFTDNGN